MRQPSITTKRMAYRPVRVIALAMTFCVLWFADVETNISYAVSGHAPKLEKGTSLTLVALYPNPNNIDEGAKTIMLALAESLMQELVGLQQKAVLLTNAQVDDLSPTRISDLGSMHGFRFGLVMEFDINRRVDDNLDIVSIVRAKCALIDAEYGEILWRGPRAERVFPGWISEKEHWAKEMRNAAQLLTDDVLKGIPMSGKTHARSTTSINSSDQNSNQNLIDALIKAVAEDDLKEVNHILKKNSTIVNGIHWNGGIAISKFAVDGTTALMEASRKGKKKIVRLLLENGADVNIVATGGVSALMLAAEENFKDIVQILITSGADVNAKQDDGVTALTGAAFYNHREVVEVLLANGANVNPRHKCSLTPLMAASMHGNTELMELLLARGADVDTENFEKETALIHSANFGHKDAVALLISKGANVNAADQYETTALMEATKDGNMEIVKLLLTNGADVTMRDHIGGTALMQAIAWHHDEIAKLLKAAESGGRVPAARGTER